MTKQTLSLREALAHGKIQDFIAQEEARGVGPVDSDELDRALAAAARPTRSEDRTSRSSSRDGSRGT
jgi:hypothetical protein